MSAAHERLAAMSAEAATAYFRDTDVLEITSTVRGASDKELTRLIGLDHVREAAVAAILGRFEEFCDRARLAAVEGVVRFELARRKKPAECHTARFAGGSVVLEPGAEPDVTVEMEIVDFLRLVTGESNAALLYLGGRLVIRGEEMLALTVGTVFTVPGGGAAIDPTRLDPVDVATAVASTSAKHMADVMAGGFRAIVLEEVFRRFPDFLDPARSADLELCVGFRIGESNDGEVDRYTVHVQRGVCTVEADPPEGQRRDATLVLDGVDFLRLVTGQLHPVRGVLTGGLKVRGDRAKALAFNAGMRPPRPRR